MKFRSIVLSLFLLLSSTYVDGAFLSGPSLVQGRVDNSPGQPFVNSCLWNLRRNGDNPLFLNSINFFVEQFASTINSQRSMGFPGPNARSSGSDSSFFANIRLHPESIIPKLKYEPKNVLKKHNYVCFTKEKLTFFGVKGQVADKEVFWVAMFPQFLNKETPQSLNIREYLNSDSNSSNSGNTNSSFGGISLEKEALLHVLKTKEGKVVVPGSVRGYGVYWMAVPRSSWERIEPVFLPPVYSSSSQDIRVLPAHSRKRKRKKSDPLAPNEAEIEFDPEDQSQNKQDQQSSLPDPNEAKIKFFTDS